MIVGFIDGNRGEFGVAPICHALQVAPSTYYSAKTRPLSDRAVRDAIMMPVLLALWKANYSVYGARKLWIAARNAGEAIGRDQVEGAEYSVAFEISMPDISRSNIGLLPAPPFPDPHFAKPQARAYGRVSGTLTHKRHLANRVI